MKDIGFILLAGFQHPLLGESRDITMSVPGRNGVYDYGATLGTISFDLPLGTVQKNAMDIQRAFRRLKSFLVDSFGRPRTFRLTFSYEPDKYYNVRYSGSLPTEREFARIGRLNLPLTCFEGFARSTATNRNVTWGSESITFENDIYLLGHSGDGQKTFTSSGMTSVTVAGDAVRPTLYIEGRGNNVQISWGGQTLILPNFPASTKWVIDFAEYTVLRNNQLAIGEIGGPWMDMYLEPGMNDITVSGSNLDMEISFEFNDRFN